MAVKLSIMPPISKIEMQDFKNKQIGTIIKTRTGTLTVKAIDNNITAANKSKSPKVLTIKKEFSSLSKLNIVFHSIKIRNLFLFLLYGNPPFFHAGGVLFSAPAAPVFFVPFLVFFFRNDHSLFKLFVF